MAGKKRDEQSSVLPSCVRVHRCWLGYTYIMPWDSKGFPDGALGKEYACQWRRHRDMRLILRSGRTPGVGNGNPLQYSYLGNSMDRGAQQSAVHGVTRVGHNLATKPPPLPYT